MKREFGKFNKLELANLCVGELDKLVVIGSSFTSEIAWTAATRGKYYFGLVTYFVSS